MSTVQPAQALARLDAQALLAKALDQGANVETLERLVALAKDMRAVQAREAWHQAMSRFQRDCPAITKSSTAKITSRRTGSSYSYKFAPLDEVLATVRPVMADNGLSHRWQARIEARLVIVKCFVSHALGHTEDSGDVAMPIPEGDEGANPAQRVGIALTYAKRYSFLGVLGIAPEDDDDAGAQDVQHKVKGRPPRAVEEDHVVHDPAPDVRPEMMDEIRALAAKAKLTPEERATSWSTYVGSGVKAEDADPAALSSLLDWLRTRAA